MIEENPVVPEQALDDGSEQLVGVSNPKGPDPTQQSLQDEVFENEEAKIQDGAKTSIGKTDPNMATQAPMWVDTTQTGPQATSSKKKKLRKVTMAK